MNDLNQPQPPPVATDEIPTWQLVQADMRARDQAGRAKYGTPHQPGNQRDHLVDAYQEVLDLACYLRAEIELRRSEARAKTQPFGTPTVGLDGPGVLAEVTRRIDQVIADMENGWQPSRMRMLEGLHFIRKAFLLPGGSR